MNAGSALPVRTANPLRRLLLAFLSIAMGAGVLAGLPAGAQAAGADPGAAPTHLTVGQLAAPVDVENLTAPLLGWQVGAGVQSAYEVQMATTAADVEAAGVWDSGKIASAENANVTYTGPALSASSGYYWRVRTWDAGDAPSAWSSVSHFGTGPGSTWAGATPIWTPGVDSGWADYTFEGTFNITGVAASVNFRAKDSTNFYMWQFRASDAPTDPSTLKTHANVNGSYAVLEVNALPFALAKGTDYDFRIVVNGTNVSTYLRPTGAASYSFVNSIDNSSFTAGGIGFRTGSTESAFYDNLKVTDPTGKVLYSNDFSTASTDFTCGTVTGGRLSIGVSKNCNYGVDWQNYAAQATFNITQGTATMSLKATSTTSFYLWQLKVGSPGTVQINKNVGGTYTTLKTVTLGKPIVAGTDYAMKVVALGNTYKTYVDDVLVDTITDATYSTGRVGFRTGGFEAFKVSNLTVTTPDGQVFYSNSFPAGNTDFTCGTIANNTLTVPINSNCVVAAPSTNWAFLRGDVTLQAGKSIAWAHLYATGGSTNPGRQYVYKMWVNGQYVGIGPTRPIGSETRYDGYDVTTLLREGAANTVGTLAYTTSDQRYLASLVVRYTDGSTQTFGTGSSWKALNGSAILPEAGSIGTSYFAAPKENFNAAVYPFGFDQPGFDDSAWKAPSLKTAFSSLTATPTAKVERQLRQPATVVEYSPGNYFIDYGRTWVGGLSLDLTGTTGQLVDIRYGEVASATNTAKYATDGGNNYQDVWTLKAGQQHLETWGMRVFRYVNVLNAPTGLGTADFQALAYVYPYDAAAGVFESSDSDLNKVWQLNKNTIEATNGNLYVDSWERERGAYEADSYLQMMANFYTSSDPTLGNYSIAYLFKQRTWPTEWPIYIVLAMHDSYAQTGDIDALSTYYTALQAKLPDAWYEPATGLVRKTSGSNGAGSCTDCDIVDWPTSERDGFVFTPYNTVINAISYRAYSDMVEIATALGKTADAATYQAKADAIKAAVNARMWDATKGAYRDGLSAAGAPTDHWAVQASVFATAFGLADDQQAASVASYIGSRGMVCSVYCSAFLFEALYNGDRADIAYDLLKSTGTRSYLNMIAKGAGATAEAWDKSLKANLTYSHPWAASIAYNMPQGLFGIKPTTAGYDTFDVKPQADSLDWAHVTVPTLKGRIGAAFDKAAGATGGVDVGVSVPANAQARVFVPGATAGATTVYVDGVATPATYVDGYARVDAVAPGCHVLSLAPGTAPGLDARLTSICAGGYTAPDLTAPTVELATDPASPTGALGWFTGPAALVVTATDAGSGVASVEYRVGDGAWLPYTDAVTAPEGETTFSARATDQRGNVSEPQSLVVRRDVTAPTVAASYDDQDGASEGPVPVTLTASDAGSGVGSISYRVDDAAWQTYDEPVQVSGAGTHAVQFSAADVAGNLSDVGEVSVRIIEPDTTPPVVTATTEPASPTGTSSWFTEPVSVVLAATDERSAVASIDYTVDNGPWVTYAGAIAVAEGVHEVHYRATDAKGNVSEPGLLVVRRDQTAPSTTASYDDQDGQAQGPVEVALVASDAGSGVGSIVYAVDGGAPVTYTGPFQVFGPSATITFHAVDVAGNVETERTEVVHMTIPDVTAPVVTGSTTPAAPTGAHGWFTGAVSFAVSATDDRSGVASLEVRVGDGAWTAYDGPLAAPQGVTTYSFRATDGAGNASSVQTLTVRRDTVAPVSQASYDDGDGTGPGPVAVTFTGTDATSGLDTVSYRVDAGAWHVADGPVQVTGTGSHTVDWYATDLAGNQEATRSLTVVIGRDATGPVVSAATTPASPDGTNGWFAGAVSVALAADDPSGIASREYREGDGPWTPYTGPIAAPMGTTSWSFRATDTLGNVSDVVSATVARDATVPITSASYDDQGGATTDPVTVTLSATDTYSGLATIGWSVDGGAWRAYDGPFEVSGAGDHVVSYAAVDLAGNVETAQQVTVRIAAPGTPDTTPPTLVVTTAPTAPTGLNGWYVGKAAVSATATDASGVARIEVRVGNGAWRAYTAALAAPAGTTSYSFRAVDVPGNVSAVATRTVKRDPTAPKVRVQVTRPRAKVAQVRLTATDPESGVSRIQYRLDGGAWRAYARVVTVRGVAPHQLETRSTNRAGLTSAVKVTTVRGRR